MSIGLVGDIVDEFEKRFLLQRRLRRRLLRRIAAGALGGARRVRKRRPVGITVSGNFSATGQFHGGSRGHHDFRRRAAIQLRADAMSATALLAEMTRWTEGGARRRAAARSLGILPGAALAVSLFLNAGASAGSYANPADWLPATSTDFAVETADNAPYFDIWRQEIGRNNEAARAHGVLIAPGLQAPLAETHWAIRSDPTTAAVTIVNFDCDPTPVLANAEVAILKCPARTVLWTGPLRTIRNQPKSCFVQFRGGNALAAGPTSPAAAKSGAFMSYDIASSSIKIGVIVNDKVLDACGAFLRLKD
jgi:hypothetical protein